MYAQKLTRNYVCICILMHNCGCMCNAPLDLPVPEDLPLTPKEEPLIPDAQVSRIHYESTMKISDKKLEVALKLDKYVSKKTLSNHLQAVRRSSSLDLQATIRRVNQKGQSRCKYKKNLLSSNKG